MIWGSALANGEPEAAQRGAAKPADSPSSRLTREDWIDAAWAALSEGSIDTVKVDRLAKRLNVTRGSFYWHFKNREDLIEAVVDRWIQRLGRTTAVHHLLDAEKPAPDRLWDVFEYVIRTVTGPQSVFLRIASQRDRGLRARMEQEDGGRVQGYVQLFLEMGLSANAAQDFADAYYVIVMSEFLRQGALPVDDRLAIARKQHAFIVAMASRNSPDDAGIAGR